MFELKDVDIIQESIEPFSISFTPSDKNLNVNGKVHGGILFLICDDVVGKYITYKGQVASASDANIHYYRPAEPNEKLTATIHERKSGRKLGVFFIELKNEVGKLVADAMITVVFA